MNQIKVPLRKISAVIITNNEEKNIERCIDSLIGVVDEIIVIDSFSTDKTEEICKSKNVRFVQHEWEGFSKSKNFGNQLVTYDLILSLDADEALSVDLQNSLLDLKNKSDVFEAYSLNRRTNFCGNWINHSGWYPDQKLRLWNKNRGHWEGEIHEKIKLNNNATIEHLNGDLLHYSYHTISDLNIQIEKSK